LHFYYNLNGLTSVKIELLLSTLELSGLNLDGSSPTNTGRSISPGVHSCNILDIIKQITSHEELGYER